MHCAIPRITPKRTGGRVPCRRRLHLLTRSQSGAYGARLPNLCGETSVPVELHGSWRQLQPGAPRSSRRITHLMQQNPNQQTGIEAGDEDFAAMFEASLKERGGDGVLKEGEVVKGTVVQVTKDYAVVDIGYKSEGQVPIAEFTNPRGELTVQVGDPVEVLLESRENDTGMVV